MKYIKDYGWVLYKKWERIPIKIFPFSMLSIPKWGYGIEFIITTDGLLQIGGPEGKERFTKFSQIKDFDAESGRIGIVWDFHTFIYNSNIEAK